MALINTIGASDANSYVSLAEANAYFLNRVHSSAWEDFEDKSKVLITSSQMLDWYIKWKGFRASTTQNMLWPRIDVVRRDGTIIADDVIPNEVKTATYEQALSSLEEDRTDDNALAGISQLKAGSLMIKAAESGVDSTDIDPIASKVYKILSDLRILGGLSVVRLQRA